MNKKVSKISVITTLYKGNKYIEQLQKMIEKNAEILRKQYDIDVEYILVNDFPDEDVILFDERPLNYIVRVQNNEVNSGIHVSRINGIKNSDGELIFILDQDDKIEKNYLLSQYENLGDNDVIVCNGYKELDNYNKVIYRDVLKHHLINKKNIYLLAANQIVSPGQCLIRKSAIPKEWLENPQYANGSDDLFLWLLILEKGIKFRVNREKLYVHVMTGENLSDDLKKMSLSDKEMLDISEKKKLLNAKDIKKRRRLIKYLNVTKSNDTTRIKKYITYLLNIDITILKIYAFYI